MAYSFPKALRLRQRAQFVDVQQNGTRLKQGGLIFLFKPNGLEYTRLGVTITRKTWPQAVRRNHLRRLLREAFRLSRSALPDGWDMVVVVTRGASKVSLGKAKELFIWAMKRPSQGQW